MKLDTYKMCLFHGFLYLHTIYLKSLRYIKYKDMKNKKTTISIVI